MESDEQMK